MVVFEEDVGIISYVNPHEGFIGVVKQRYSDFIVREVSLNTTRPCCIDSIEFVSTVNHDIISKEHVSCDEYKLKLIELIGEENVEKLILLQDNGLRQENDEMSVEQQVILPPEQDKSRRTQVHHVIRELFSNLQSEMLIDTESSSIKQILVSRKASNSDSRKRASDDQVLSGKERVRKHARTERDSDRFNRLFGDEQDWKNGYVHAVLAKVNVDTTDAISRLSRLLHIGVKYIGHAGTKDKRAVTYQRISVKGLHGAKLAALNQHLRDMRIGNIDASPSKKGLQLGQLYGNRFTIVLRHLAVQNESGHEQCVSEVVSNAIQQVEANGFVNYFGLQRFGAGAVPTHEVGIKVLQGDFKEAIRYILTPLDPSIDNPEMVLYEERKNTIFALTSYLNGSISASECLEKLQHSRNLERYVLEHYSKDGRANDHATAFKCIPKNMRKMYLHSVQSYLWNRMASFRLNQNRISAQFGDLVFVEKCGIENGTDSAVEDGVVDTEKEIEEIEKNDDLKHSVHVVTEEEEKKKVYGIEKVVLPMIGYGTEFPKGELGVFVENLMKEHGFDLRIKTSITDEYGLKGSYRRLIAFPKNVEYEIKSYKTEDEKVVTTELETLLDSVESKTNGMDKNCAEQEDNDRALQTLEPIHSESEIDDAKLEIKHALVVSFTLKAAQYATMFLRELTKHDSSVAAQKLLQSKTHGAPRA
eukprot:CAMPEP_0182446370 /NCGR_PEP_ID=MMETSP1172-20130603/4155_1 /TAXON_ID=708627 /ORGANISM="Timspurckia oligopyrenoides, Strain CCMP3278" /LENGTH=699 /DNA_ID=CAMNT_0024642287 /DNA_START=2200 /DNA_END=4296 /DNA_ORIENTATION=+